MFQPPTCLGVLCWTHSRPFLFVLYRIVPNWKCNLTSAKYGQYFPRTPGHALIYYSPGHPCPPLSGHIAGSCPACIQWFPHHLGRADIFPATWAPAVQSQGVNPPHNTTLHFVLDELQEVPTCPFLRPIYFWKVSLPWSEGSVMMAAKPMQVLLCYCVIIYSLSSTGAFIKTLKSRSG